MGTFGTGIFDNDSALDWIAEFNSRKSIKTLEKVLTSFEKNRELAEGEIVAACCDVIAAISGHPSDDLDPDIEEWADKQRAKLPDTLLSRAHAAATWLCLESELAVLWKESNDFQSWQSIQQNLVERLSRTPLAAGILKPRRPPTIELRGSKSGSEFKRFRIAQNLPRLEAEVPGVGIVSQVIVRLAQQLDISEAVQIADWLSAYPHVSLTLSDYKKPRSYSIDPELLKAFSKRIELSLSLESITSLAFLEGFYSLEKLELSFVKATNSLSILAKLPALKELTLYECRPSAFGDLAKVSEFPALKVLKILYIRTLYLAEGGPIQTNLELDTLPQLPTSLNELTLHCVSIKNIESLQAAVSLTKLDIFGMRCETTTLDFRNCPILRRLELVNLQGVKSLYCAPALTSLQLQNVFGLKARFPDSVASIRALRVSVDSVVDEVQSKTTWDGLQALVLVGAESFAFLKNFNNSPQLEYLHVEGARSAPESFAAFPKLRYVAAFEFDGNPTMFSALKEARALRELTLIYSFEESISPQKEHFLPLAGLPDFDALAVTSLHFEDAVRDEIGNALGVKVSSWIANSAGDSFLRELEASL